MSVLLSLACLVSLPGCVIGQQVADRLAFQEGAESFVSELLQMSEPSEPEGEAAELLAVFVLQSAERYAFWRTNGIAYHLAEPALVMGKVDEKQLCSAVHEIVRVVRGFGDHQRFFIRVLMQRCPRSSWYVEQ